IDESATHRAGGVELGDRPQSILVEPALRPCAIDHSADTATFAVDKIVDPRAIRQRYTEEGIQSIITIGSSGGPHRLAAQLPGSGVYVLRCAGCREPILRVVGSRDAVGPRRQAIPVGVVFVCSDDRSVL